MNADITHISIVVSGRAQPISPIPRIPPDMSLSLEKRSWQATWHRQDCLGRADDHADPGRRRISKTEAALFVAGFDITGATPRYPEDGPEYGKTVG